MKASIVCPDRERPLLSLMVRESISSTRLPIFFMALSAATRAALELRVSKIVSIRNASTPPSINADICSSYASVISSKETERAAGSSAFSDIDSILPVGPTLPATKRGRSGVISIILSASSRASLAAAIFISLIFPCIPYSACDMRCAPNEQVETISAPASRYPR